MTNRINITPLLIGCRAFFTLVSDHLLDLQTGLFCHKRLTFVTTTFPNPLLGGRLRKLHANVLNFWLIFDIYTRCYRTLKNFSQNHHFDV